MLLSLSKRRHITRHLTRRLGAALQSHTGSNSVRQETPEILYTFQSSFTSGILWLLLSGFFKPLNSTNYFSSPPKPHVAESSERKTPCFQRLRIFRQWRRGSPVLLQPSHSLVIVFSGSACRGSCKPLFDPLHATKRH